MRKFYTTGSDLRSEDGEAEPRGLNVPVYLASEVDALLKGWRGYAWKDGEYIDDIQAFLEQASSNGLGSHDADR